MSICFSNQIPSIRLLVNCLIRWLPQDTYLSLLPLPLCCKLMIVIASLFVYCHFRGKKVSFQTWVNNQFSPLSVALQTTSLLANLAVDKWWIRCKRPPGSNLYTMNKIDPSSHRSPSPKPHTSHVTCAPFVSLGSDPAWGHVGHREPIHIERFVVDNSPKTLPRCCLTSPWDAVRHSIKLIVMQVRWWTQPS